MRRTAVTALLAVAGVTCVLLAVTDRQRPTPPTIASAGSFGPPAFAPVRADVPPPSSAAPARASRKQALSPSRPIGLSIPALGVTSKVQEVGQAADGSIVVPPPGSRYDEAAWYRHSPTPGARGPAVVIGHVDSAAGGPSVFFRLAELKPADTVRIARADGSTAEFVVNAVRFYPKNRFPSAKVYGDTAGAELRLITCGGPFDRRSGHYKDNVVVFASLLRTAPPPSR
jgi:hypothetical protein